MMFSSEIYCRPGIRGMKWKIELLKQKGASSFKHEYGLRRDDPLEEQLEEMSE